LDSDSDTEKSVDDHALNDTQQKYVYEYKYDEYKYEYEYDDDTEGVKGTVNDRHFNWKVCQTLQTEGTFQ